MVTTPNDAELPDTVPSAEQQPAVSLPVAVVVSFWILIGSAALRMLIVAYTAVNWNNAVNQLLAQPRPNGTTLAQAHSAIDSYLAANITLDVVFALLYVFFAFMARRGRNWARVTITVVVAVFAVLGVLSGTDWLTLLRVLAELIAVGLLYVRVSKEYFAAAKAATKAATGSGRR